MFYLLGKYLFKMNDYLLIHTHIYAPINTNIYIYLCIFIYIIYINTSEHRHTYIDGYFDFFSFPHFYPVMQLVLPTVPF